jgi:hypothetical protein
MSIGEDVLTIGTPFGDDWTASSRQYHQHPSLHEQWYASVDVTNQLLSPMNEYSPDNVMDARLGVTSMVMKQQTQKVLPTTGNVSSSLSVGDSNDDDVDGPVIDDAFNAVQGEKGRGSLKRIEEDNVVSVASLLPKMDDLSNDDAEY